MCVREHADIMGQFPDPVSLGGKTQALENAYQFKEFKWKQIVTSPDAPFTRGEKRTASTTARFVSFVMREDWPISWRKLEHCSVWQTLVCQAGWTSKLVRSACPAPLSFQSPSSVHKTCFLSKHDLPSCGSWEMKTLCLEHS